jgi:peptide/bleomycin uptake transporter
VSADEGAGARGATEVSRERLYCRIASVWTKDASPRAPVFVQSLFCRVGRDAAPAPRAMIREFFFARERSARCLAWFGLLAFVAHAGFKAWLKFALNAWFRAFYDGLQVPTEDDADLLELGRKRDAVNERLFEFGVLVLPAVFVHPVARWISSVWRLNWRLALVRAYLRESAKRPAALRVEGAAQRIHEDTQRFASGVHACGVTVLDSLLTLVVFVPILARASDEARPEWASPGWLVVVASVAAIGGLGVSILVAHRLVALEVENQKVEAELRTDLVVAERDAASEPVDALPRVEDAGPGAARFVDILSRLKQNYRTLFRYFVYFDTWISAFDQGMTLLPYALVAPLIFDNDPTRRITLGTLMSVTNAFDRVFSALAVLTENWASVNDFRSTLRRLRSFEAALRVGSRRAPGAPRALAHVELE